MIAFCIPDVKIFHQFARFPSLAHIPRLRIPSTVNVEEMEKFYMDLISTAKD